MVIRELIKEISSSLSGRENYLYETHLIIRTVLGLTPMELVLSHGNDVSEKDAELIRSYAERRKTNKPLQYILGTEEFMGIEFYVEREVLIPRQDTETLVEEVLRHLASKGASVLDIGAGSGCVGLSILYHNPNTCLRGIDVSDNALNLSRRNAEKLGVTERADFVKADILTDHISGKYDVVVSNPPYIRSDVIPTLMTDVQDFEPHLALDGGEDGLKFYRAITEKAQVFLRKGGLLAFETGYDQGEAVAALMADTFDDVKIIKDLCGNDRVVRGILK